MNNELRAKNEELASLQNELTTKIDENQRNLSQLRDENEHLQDRIVELEREKADSNQRFANENLAHIKILKDK